MIGTAVASLMEFNAFFNLLADAFLGLAVGGIESRIAAKGAATCADCPVTVGTTKTCIDADFLHAAPELLREVVTVAVKSSIVAPRV